MAGASLLNSELYRGKLQALTTAQQSIENLSTWCMFYHSEHKQIVEVWLEEFQKAGSEKRLPFLYLANDLVQNGRKKCPDMPGAFFSSLLLALKAFRKTAPAKNIDRAKRMVTVWGERRVYSQSGVKQLLDQLNSGAPADQAPASATSAPVPHKRAKHEHHKSKVPVISDDNLRQAAEAAKEVTKREKESEEWLFALTGPCRANLEVDGTDQELLKAEVPLQNYVLALEAEIAARSRAAEMAQAFVDAQSAATQGVEQKLGLTRAHLVKIRERMATLKAGNGDSVKADADQGGGGKVDGQEPCEEAPPGGGGAGAGADDEYDPEDP